jgi:hypothetical protein
VELPLDTLLGPTFDGVDVITGSGEHEANEKAFELWSLLLNHGYRLAATASSDACFDRPGGGVPGIVRTYTYLPHGFSLPRVTKATSSGRTFATTGPLLLATIDGAPPGSTFAVGSKTHLLSIEAWASGKDDHGLRRIEVLRNGRLLTQFMLEGQPSFVKTNLPLQELQNAWYCVRVFGTDLQKQKAITGAFYFDQKDYHLPAPVKAQVFAQILDAQSGNLIPGTLTEVACSGTIVRVGKRHHLINGNQKLAIPGTVRLKAEAKGYLPLTLSPILDNPDLVQLVTGLNDADLTDWKTFEHLKAVLSNVHLIFRLHRQ